MKIELTQKDIKRIINESIRRIVNEFEIYNRDPRYEGMSDRSEFETVNEDIITVREYLERLMRCDFPQEKHDEYVNGLSELKESIIEELQKTYNWVKGRLDRKAGAERTTVNPNMRMRGGIREDMMRRGSKDEFLYQIIVKYFNQIPRDFYRGVSQLLMNFQERGEILVNGSFSNSADAFFNEIEKTYNAIIDSFDISRQ